MKTNVSRTALFVCLMITIILSACGAGAATEPPVPPATNTPAPTATITLTATATTIPTKTPLPTNTPNIAATQKYDGFFAWVEKLASEGVISSTQGEYHSLEDYSDELAKTAYYNWVTYEKVETNNFIIQARVKLFNATTENVFKSACGFVMTTPYSSQHAIFLALDGNVNFRTDGGDRGSNFVSASLYDNPDGVLLTLVLSNKSLAFYVNEEKVFTQTVYDESLMVGPSVLSGTAEGFGTRCEFTEMVLWDMK